MDAELVVDGGHGPAFVFNDVRVALYGNNADDCHAYFFLGLRFLAVFAASLKALAVGAPFEPGLRIFSPDPAAIRFRLAAMLAYKPRFLRMDLAPMI